MSGKQCRTHHRKVSSANSAKNSTLCFRRNGCMTMNLCQTSAKERCRSNPRRPPLKTARRCSTGSRCHWACSSFCGQSCAGHRTHLIPTNAPQVIQRNCATRLSFDPPILIRLCRHHANSSQGKMRLFIVLDVVLCKYIQRNEAGASGGALSAVARLC